MKKNVFKKIFNLSWLILAALLTFTACEDDDDNDDDIVLDGVYIKGDATGVTSLVPNGRFALTKNEVNQTERASLYEIYMPISATGGFNIVKVMGKEKTTYGPGADFALVALADRNGDEPKDEDFWRGSYAVSTTEFTVPEDGFYHVVVDTELGTVVIARVVWGVIGAATPGGWSSSTALTESAFNKTTMSYTITNLALKVGDWKFRYSSGWKIILDEDIDLGGGVVGVKVNTNFGGAVAALVPGGDNISNTTPGYYTVTVTWTLGTGTVATATKTGDLPMTDYSTYNMGFIGDGVLNASDVAVGWDVTYNKKTPTKVGNIYTWSWTGIKVVTTGSFKIRQNDDWTGLILGYPQVTKTGAGATNFTGNGDGNFVPAANGTYNFTLTIDASSEVYTLNIVAAK
jgi:hypothetical protein